MRSQIYFPILRAKAGEFRAMGALAEQTKSLVCPLFDLPVIHEPSEFAYLQSSVVQELAKNWGTANELFLDLFRYDPDSLMPDGVSCVARLFASARQTGLKSIPVAGPVLERGGVTSVYLNSVAEIAARDGRGAAIRLPYDDLKEADELNSIVDEVQQMLSLGDANCDVILDIGAADSLPGGLAKSANVLKETLSLAVQALERRRFRALVVCASSIPRKLVKSKDGGPIRIPNSEYQFWSQLMNSVAFRHARFGDYTARYANQSDKKSKAAPPARIHLTTPEMHVLHVAKGETYRELAKDVANTPAFDAQRGYWGRYAVRDAADGRDGVGGATDWVARDTHMHVETMTHSARERLGEVGVVVRESTAATDPIEQADLALGAYR